LTIAALLQELNTAMVHLARSGNVRVVESLVERGADVNAKEDDDDDDDDDEGEVSSALSLTVHRAR
jgi:hypothetical protein